MKEENKPRIYDKIFVEKCRARYVLPQWSEPCDDFRQLDPRHNIPLFQKYLETKFDLYHMGMPWVRDTAFIAKNYHNVYLNLCWSHIVSSHMTVSGLLEYFDIVSVNKIIAFGGDYTVYSLEKNCKSLKNS